MKWNTRSSGSTAHLSSVAFTGTVFMAVGDAGTVLLSNAGGTAWTKQSGTGATGDLGMVAIEAAGSRLVGGENELRLDTSFGFSSTWTDQVAVSKASPAPKATYLAALWDGTNFVAGGRGGLTVTGKRPTAGAEFGWSTFPSPTRSWLFDITTAVGTGTNLSATWAGGAVRYATNRTTNTFYVAVGDQATIVTSDNGAAWSTALTPASSTGAIYLGVAGDTRGLVAVGNKGTLSFSPVDHVATLVTNFFTNGAVVATVVFTNQVNALGLGWYAGRSPTASVARVRRRSSPVAPRESRRRDRRHKGARAPHRSARRRPPARATPSARAPRRADRFATTPRPPCRWRGWWRLSV